MIERYPLVSFIITAYNAGKFIIDCVDSCLNQSYPNIEVIITDDGSTDNTIDMLTKTYYNNDRVKISKFRNNKGKVAGFNNSYQYSSGEYIAVMGADDVNYQTRIMTQYELIKEGDFSFVASDLDVINSEGILIHCNLSKTKYNFKDRIVTFEDLLLYYKVYGATLFCKRKYLDKIFPLSEKLPQESWWIPQILTMYSPGYYTSESLCAYRKHGNNSTSIYTNIDSFRYMKTRDRNYYTAIEIFIINSNFDKHNANQYFSYIKQQQLLISIFSRDKNILRNIITYINSYGISKELIVRLLPHKVWYLYILIKYKINSGDSF